ncbi:UDP-3-O-(3-hydroxymyristoyl)glucosamine N-acyltransferase [Flavobacteriaceae bacterium Ap0902]|nr:UDP-3-O-(3-hydroxymyristoyl)glucosamine N-acyltransferase [Flavobacteriaceae bacterium Ap0902]
MKFTVAQIADFIDGEIIGDPEISVSGFGKIEDAGENELTFLANEKYRAFLNKSNASVIIISRNINIPEVNGKSYIKVDDAYAAMTTLLNVYQNLQQSKSGIEKPSYISESAQIGNNAYIGAFAYIGNHVKIGDNVKIYPHVYLDDHVEVQSNTTIYAGTKIYNQCVIGEHCIIHSGAIIGSDGFGFQPDNNGVFHKVPQIGNVIIEDHVEIGAACTIDRATMGSTVIKKGVKLDNQIQVAHNVVIGEHTVIASQSGVAGSSKIGKNNMIGGQVGIAGHLNIGDGVHIQAQSGINSNIEANKQLYGSPAMDAMDFRKSYVYFRKLPELVGKLNQLEKKVNEQK